MHLVKVGKRSVAHLDYICVAKMLVASKVNQARSPPASGASLSSQAVNQLNKLKPACRKKTVWRSPF